MIFVKTNKLPSGYLRADQIAKRLGVPVYLNELPDVSRETIVFVKDAKRELVYKAKESGCKIVYDPIDTFAYTERQKWYDWHSLVDVVIAYNKSQAGLYENWFRSSVIIPHQWDERLEGQSCSHDAFRPAYIGNSFNCYDTVLNSGIEIVSAPELMLPAMAKYNCHVSIRDALHGKMKPATKLACAAAVGAVFITTRDDAVCELLPEDYPYWCDGEEDFPDVLAKVREEFATASWHKARDMMKVVREKTCPDMVAQLYLNILRSPSP